MFLPPFKGTMLRLGLDTHHCLTGLSFRWNRTAEHSKTALPFQFLSFFRRRQASDVLRRKLCRSGAYILRRFMGVMRVLGRAEMGQSETLGREPAPEVNFEILENNLLH
jgi:hypothetical protein